MCWNGATVDNAISLKKRWTLTEVAFNQLLDCFDSDRQRAGEKYEQLRRKLEKFFEVHRSPIAEELADETINRVARKLEEGLVIQNVAGYSIGVARLVFRESLKRQSKTVELGDEPSSAVDPGHANPSEVQLRCLDGCLEKLNPETRMLIIEYYQLKKQAKIDHRKVLAEKLGIPVNALRIRVHRLRGQLEECVIRCAAKSAMQDDMH